MQWWERHFCIANLCVCTHVLQALLVNHYKNQHDQGGDREDTQLHIAVITAATHSAPLSYPPFPCPRHQPCG